MITGKQSESLLSTIRDLISRLLNGKVCIGSETITMATDTTTIKSLTVPSGATSAVITVEVSAASTNTNAGVRYSLSTTAPSATMSSTGMPLGDYDTIEIVGGSNLSAFRAICVDSTPTKYLKVQYFK